MGCFSASTFLMIVCVATGAIAGWLFLNSQHTNVAGLLTFVSMASAAKMVAEIEGEESPYERGLAEANLVLAKNRRTR